MTRITTIILSGIIAVGLAACSPRAIREAKQTVAQADKK